MFLIEKINYKNIEELKSKPIKKALFSKGKINKKSGGPGAQKLFFVPKRSCGNQAMLQSWQQTTLFSRVTCFIALAKTRPCDLQMQQRPVLQIDFGTKL